MSNQIRVGRAAGKRSQVRVLCSNMFALLLLVLMLASGSAQAGSDPARPPLDLNRATAEELVALPGIGEAKAAAILAVRDAQGGFQSVDELESVRGIGPAIAAKLRPLVVVGARSPRSSKASKQAGKQPGTEGARRP